MDFNAPLVILVFAIAFNCERVSLVLSCCPFILFTIKLFLYPTFWSSPSYCSAPNAMARAGFSSSLGEWPRTLPGVIKYCQCKGIQFSGWKKTLLPQFLKQTQLLVPPPGFWENLLCFKVTSNFILGFLSVNTRSGCFRSTYGTNIIARCEDTSTFPFD